MIPDVLRKVLEATAYFESGSPAPGVRIGDDPSRRRRLFRPDALWRGTSALTVYFKYEDTPPPPETIAAWRQEIWNEGFAPLLWVVSPERIDVFNGFGRPLKDGDATRHHLGTFKAIDRALRELDVFAGRLAMETGQFWLQTEVVTRKTSVDQQLLIDLAVLERDLVRARLDRPAAQALIGRSIFTQYLIDRKIVDEGRLRRQCAVQTLPQALRKPAAAKALFQWLSVTFNGDMFPGSSSAQGFREEHLSRVADFLEAVDPGTGQMSLFPYQFDIIPVELISSIYEQFAHSKAGAKKLGPREESGDAKDLAIHYTRLPLVSLILDEVMQGLTGDETVLDLTCGSGVFLVESLRRLVRLKDNNTPQRRTIRSVLYDQICGVDISDAAIRVAAFSLYLAALELDRDPHPPEALKFRPLIGRTLRVANAYTVDSDTVSDGRGFDVIVGNPPWSFKGKRGTEQRHRHRGLNEPLQPRGEALDFLMRAADFSHERTRYGMVLSAMPFFAASKTGAAAALNVVRQLSPVTIVNLAAHSQWLFGTAKMPAVILLARCRPQRHDQLTVVNVPWSKSSERSHTFEISPSNIVTLSLERWEKDPNRLKAAAFGSRRDILLLDDLRSRYGDLRTWLASIDSKCRDGLILGKPERRNRDASYLRGLEVLGTDDLEPFRIPDKLERFREDRAQWPRGRETYRAPFLVIKEFLKAGPRPITALVDRDLIYTDAFFGARLGEAHRQSGHLIAAIMSSALASWFFLITASEFGLWKRRLLTKDVGLLPLPDPNEASRTTPGREILEIEKAFRRGAVSSRAWPRLDEAVFDLYGLDEADRAVVSDGLLRARAQWQDGRDYLSAPAEPAADLWRYAEMFVAGIDPWLQAVNKRRMRAEVFDLQKGAPLRVVRFVLENQPGPSRLTLVKPRGDLTAVLSQLGERLGVRLGSSLVGQRELRVHGSGEVIVIKPAARRFWLQSSAIEDADAVIEESVTGARM